MNRIELARQFRAERQRALSEANKQKETEELLLEQMVDMDFRQSMMEMGGIV